MNANDRRWTLQRDLSAFICVHLTPLRNEAQQLQHGEVEHPEHPALLLKPAAGRRLVAQIDGYALGK